MAKSIKTFILLAGAVVLAVPTWLMAMWIAIFQRQDLDHAAKVAEFVSLAPNVVGDPFALTVIALGCSIVGIMSGTACFNEAGGIRKFVAAIEIVLGVILAFLLLFSLM